jgi:predicted transcriptional regulator
MLTAPQLRAARALLGIDQGRLAKISGVSLATIQRMEASKGTVRGSIDTLSKIIAAFDGAGVEVIRAHMPSREGGAGVRFREASPPDARSTA